jgi:hypothetical protein
VAARLQADGAAQRLVDLLLDPVQTPLAERRVRGLPRWILARKIAPGTAGTQDIEDGVDEEPQRPGPRPATLRWRWQQQRQLGPFCSSQVTRIKNGPRRWRARHKVVSSLWGASELPGTATRVRTYGHRVIMVEGARD